MNEDREWLDYITGVYFIPTGETERQELPPAGESEGGFGYQIESGRIAVPGMVPSGFTFIIETNGFGTFKSVVPNDGQGGPV
ncbi:hypothetical protein [Metabacillus fastidiosus]|uniref:hypothetical protein n=1 Tax=Metabacillus fastidiosus TaxID=1458 RepID=UPI002E1BF84D|nr:hypothetical protein [Metabacillus fastidiosus]